ncbi:PTS ascorbate transporter subunit IIC [Salipaludibacillus daqingensis]|uniref:PTS ascorbate transporter subunit IIC n=1 Tax=Salipaludibacillus daqingensis TaxID=3041001 RepID=UPI002476409B|nr:PTS ascorbate transporter subunit IIC [Salipaludibacillus daqingensis]
MNVTDLINRGVFGEPAFLLGMVAFIGLILIKAEFHEVISGTVKTMVGYILLQVGATAAGASLSNLTLMIQEGFQVIGIIPHNEAITALVQINYGQEVAIMMLIGMVGHFLIARFTPIKYIFLSGHHILFMSSVITSVLMTSILTPTLNYVVGGGVLALSLSLAPAISQPFVRKTVGNDQIAIAHFNSIGYVLSGTVAKLFKPPKQPLTMPKSLQKLEPLMHDHILMISFFSFMLFFISSLFVGPAMMQELFSGRNFFIFSVIQAMWFTAGMYVILTGVRMMLSEIVPAFKGIAERWIPHAIPALDAPILFTYAPYAAIFGFFISFFAGLVSMFVMASMQFTIIIPGVIPHFFAGGAAGVIAYKIGGGKGLVVSTALHGVLITVLPLFLLGFMSELGFMRTTYGDSDLNIIGILLGWLLQ